MQRESNLLFLIYPEITIFNNVKCLQALFYLLLFSVATAFSQTYSLKDSAQVNELNTQALQLSSTNPDSAILLSDQALAIAEKIRFEPGIGKSNHQLALFWNIKGDYPKAFQYYSIALSTWEALENSVRKDPASSYSLHYVLARKSATIGNIGNLNREQGYYSKALEYYFKGLKIDETLKRKAGIATKLGNIGSVYKDQKEYQQALNYYFNALKVDRSLENKDGIARHLGNIGNVYREMGQLDKALYYFNAGLQFEYELENQARIATKLGNIGIVYMTQADSTKDPVKRNRLYQIAMKNYQNAVKFFTDLGDKVNLSTSYGNTGSLYQKMAEFDKTNSPRYLSLAEKDLKESLSLAQETGSLEDIRTAHFNLSNLYSSLNKPSQALDHYRLFVATRDSIFNEDNTRRTVQAEMNYEFEKKESQAKMLQEQKDAIAAKERERQNLILGSVVSGLLLVIVFSGLLYNRVRVIDQQKKIIQEQKIIVEEKNKDITDSIMYAQRIQKAMLATDALLGNHLGSTENGHFILFKPKDIVSGDFYWATEKNNRFYLAICDSTGHGVPGAFMSLLNISFLNEAINEKELVKPNEIFDHVRRRLVENISSEGARDGMDGILFCFEKSSDTIHYAAANSAPVLVNGIMKELPFDKMHVGLGDKKQSFTHFEFRKEKGAILYCYTDGFPDQFGGPQGKKFKHKRVKELLLNTSSNKLRDQREMITESFNSWKGNLEQIDDVLLAGIRL